MEVGFNSRYLLEMMTQIEGDTAQFLLNDSASPAIVRDTADVSALYVVMPMRRYDPRHSGAGCVNLCDATCSDGTN